jgi:hypothetical protein
MSKSKGIEFIVAFVPTKYRVYRRVADFSEASDAVKGWQLNNLPDELRTIVASIDSSIGFIDLTQALEKASSHGVITYLLDDTHWTPEGHQVVAPAIHNLLTSRSQN